MPPRLAPSHVAEVPVATGWIGTRWWGDKRLTERARTASARRCPPPPNLTQTVPPGPRAQCAPLAGWGMGWWWTGCTCSGLLSPLLVSSWCLWWPQCWFHRRWWHWCKCFCCCLLLPVMVPLVTALGLQLVQQGYVGLSPNSECSSESLPPPPPPGACPRRPGTVPVRVVPALDV